MFNENTMFFKQKEGVNKFELNETEQELKAAQQMIDRVLDRFFDEAKKEI